jgi:hypothetical protein
MIKTVEYEYAQGPKKTPEKNKNKNELEVENTVCIPYLVPSYREIL